MDRASLLEDAMKHKALEMRSAALAAILGVKTSSQHADDKGLNAYRRVDDAIDRYLEEQTDLGFYVIAYQSMFEDTLYLEASDFEFEANHSEPYIDENGIYVERVDFEVKTGSNLSCRKRFDIQNIRQMNMSIDRWLSNEIEDIRSAIRDLRGKRREGLAKWNDHQDERP